MGLKKLSRLNLRLHRERLDKTGKTFGNSCFTVVVAPAATSTPRFAILVTKKLLPLSVDRHQLKRQIEAIIQNFPDTSPADYLIIPRFSAIKADFKFLSTSLNLLLNSKT